MIELTDAQIEMLGEPLAPADIGQKNGRPYIPGGAAIKNANRIFGFGGWRVKFVGEQDIRHMSETCDIYIQHAELYIYGELVSTGVGTGTALLNNPSRIADEVDSAIKGARTDAMKRCFRWFGPQFGSELGLDGKAQAQAQAQGQAQRPANFDFAAWRERIHGFKADPAAFNAERLSVERLHGGGDKTPPQVKDALGAAARAKRIVFDVNANMFVKAPDEPPAANPSGAGLPEAPMPGADASGQAQLGA